MGILGLLIGSFINVCIVRIPEGESIVFPPSRCPRCQKRLSPLDLIPVISYLLLRGKCRHCGEKISARYPLVEILVSVLFILVYRKYGLSISALAYAVLAAVLVAASFIDLEHMIIPDALNIFLGAVGLLFLLAGQTVSWQQALLGFAAGGGILLLLGYLSVWILKKEGMGGGDIKLAAVCGLYLGFERILLSLMMAFYYAAAIVLLLLLAGRLKKGQYLPFGPFIAAGAITAALYFNEIISFYMRLFVRT